MSIDGLIPRRYDRMADLPPPGNARRRLLRQFGLAISRDDFTDEELAQRGIAIDPPAPREREGPRG